MSKYRYDEFGWVCRNCMSRWYREAANESGFDMDESMARKIIYGMDYANWKEKFSRPQPNKRQNITGHRINHKASS